MRIGLLFLFLLCFGPGYGQWKEMPSRYQMGLQWTCDTGIAHFFDFGYNSLDYVFNFAPQNALLQAPIEKTLGHLFDSLDRNSVRNAYAIGQKTILCTVGTWDPFNGDTYSNYILKINAESEELDTIYTFPPMYRIMAGNFFFQNTLRGFFFGEPDSIRKCRFIISTEDGGASWKLVETAASLPYSIIEAQWTYEGRGNYYNPMPDELFGLKNGAGYLMREITLDSREGKKSKVFQWTAYGKQWKELKLPDHFKPLHFSAKDINHLVLLSRHDYGKMFISKDAGNSWDSIPLPIPPDDIIWVDSANNNQTRPFLLACKRWNADSLVRVLISFNEGNTWYRVDEDLMKIEDMTYWGNEMEFFFIDAEHLILSYRSHAVKYRPFLFDYERARALSFPQISEPLVLCLGDSVQYGIDLDEPGFWSFHANGKDTFQLGMPLVCKPSRDTAIYLFTRYHSDTLHIRFREDFPSGVVEEKYFICMDSALNLDLSQYGSKEFIWSNGQNGPFFTCEDPGKYTLNIEQDYYCKQQIDFEVVNFPRHVHIRDTGICFDDQPPGSVNFQNDLSLLVWLAHVDSSQLPVFYHPQRAHFMLTDTNGCPADLYFEIANQCPPEIFLPNAFHPLGPIEVNRVFKPVTRYIDAYEMEIYNRWGQCIYKGNEHDKGWDGTFQNELSISGIYFYFVSYTYTRGSVQEKRTVEGRISLIN